MQGGLLTGVDPSAFNPSDPLRLWIIQVGVSFSYITYHDGLKPTIYRYHYYDGAVALSWPC